MLETLTVIVISQNMDQIGTNIIHDSFLRLYLAWNLYPKKFTSLLEIKILNIIVTYIAITVNTMFVKKG